MWTISLQEMPILRSKFLCFVPCFHFGLAEGCRPLPAVCVRALRKKVFAANDRTCQSHKMHTYMVETIPRMHFFLALGSTGVAFHHGLEAQLVL